MNFSLILKIEIHMQFEANLFNPKLKYFSQNSAFHYFKLGFVIIFIELSAQFIYELSLIESIRKLHGCFI